MIYLIIFIYQVLPSFNCTCQDGFTGYTCDTPINYCTDLPCENDGNCTSKETGYECDCPTGSYRQWIR